MKAERRYVVAEVRATDGDSPKIAGHAALFNVRSQNLGGFVEIIAPGAFDACLASNPDILCLFNHDMNAVPLGRTTSATLRPARSVSQSAMVSMPSMGTASSTSRGTCAPPS